MRYPSDQEFFEFFGVHSWDEDDVFFYKVSDNSGVELTMSVRPSDDSLQTMLKHHGRTIAVVCHEGLTQLSFVADVLIAEFRSRDMLTKAEIRVRPQIHVDWSGLRVG